MKRQEVLIKMEHQNYPQISVIDYYAGKSVFITGATGFMGKVLVEKLLRSCPTLKTIYVLIRTKKGKTAEDRLKEYLNNRVFERLRNDGQPALSKIRAIAGDVSELELGISNQDREELRRECNVIFHCAATVRFDLSIRESVKINVAGTSSVLKLAEEMRNLEVYTHVSTSFCHDEVQVLEEKVYSCRQKPEDILRALEWMGDDMISELEPKLIKPLPNTYAYSKALSEDVVTSYGGKFPIIITRPSIVIAAYKEPIPGWVDSINGPTGIIVGAARGVLHSVHCPHGNKMEVMPVDLAVNGCIIAACVTALEKPQHVKVCNITQSGINSQPWITSGYMWCDLIKKYPFSPCLWYPTAWPVGNRVRYELEVFFSQFLPACFLDLLLYLFGQKTFMLKVYKRVVRGMDLLRYYIIRDWIFKNDYFLSLRKRISKEENEIFYTDIGVIDHYAYMDNYVKGVREFCCKEDPSTLPQARKLQKRLYMLHVTMKILLLGLFLYIFYTYFKPSFTF